MANMMDYLDWRGDLTFTASGFNEVDNLLFAELVYTSFDGIVTGQSEAEAVTLAEASAVFWEQNSREEILARVSMTKAAPFVLEKMAKTERFRDVKLWCSKSIPTIEDSGRIVWIFGSTRWYAAPSTISLRNPGPSLL